MAANQSIILLVEDNPRDAELTMMALERNRIANEVVLARDGVEALEYLYGSDGTNLLPNLVLLDLKLPRIDGLEVLDRIRSERRTAHLPVVILTSSDEEQDLLASYQRHANSYVRKPVDFHEFSEVVAHLGLYWLVVNKSPQAENR